MRLKKVLSRQDPPSFGRDYIPSILATTAEAPTGSWALKVFWPKIGRYIHVLSKLELGILVIVLYCPWLFDIQEQRLLHFDERPHPLSGHAKASQVRLPPLPGALQVAEWLGLIEQYPLVSCRDRQGNFVVIPSAWYADFLLFLEDVDGAFCTNLDVKPSLEDFARDRRRFSPADQMLADAKTQARHLIEEVRYSAGAIKTIQVAAEDELDWHVVENLRQILSWQKRRVEYTEAQNAEIICNYQAAMARGESALDAIYRMKKSGIGLDTHQLKLALHRAIWNRQLRVDLFQPVLVDRPLRPQHEDVLHRYRSWLSRN
ncbi:MULTISPECIES: hypothetical protein [unclassified Variovorax]|uniref:hypothetical protein n=1 Tax=unclassified Variovorax TaxID=663243 RepID=UPI003ECF7F23